MGMGTGATVNMQPQDHEAAWARVRARIRSEFGEAAFKSWLKPLTFLEVIGGKVRLSVSTRFMRDWVSVHYGDRLLDAWKEEVGGVTGLEIQVETGTRTVARPQGPGAIKRPPAPEAGTTAAPPPANGHDASGTLVRSGAESTVVPGEYTLDPRFTFESFVVGSPNELAYAAAQRAADADAVPFNPLFLYGGVGLGKTHLMHAIAWRIRARSPGRRVLFIPAEQFMVRFIRALRFKDTMAFKEEFRSVDVLMIDDLHFIGGRDATQEEFFHTFNALVDQNRQVVISADKSPSDLEGVEERLRSRLGWGLVADIHPTTYELRLSILEAKAEAMRAPIPSKVLEFLAHKITSNVRELEGALNRIVAQHQLDGRPITLEAVQHHLRAQLRANDRHVTIEEIQKRVCEHFNLRISDMHSARRARAVARPRQVAMYLAKQLTPRSLPEIGRKFGGRDHTTVMHACRKIDELRAIDNQLAEDIDLLRRMLES